MRGFWSLGVQPKPPKADPQLQIGSFRKIGDPNIVP